MKKLTNEIVAKALGWKNLGSRKIGSVIKPITHKGWWYPNGDFFSYATPPPFTTSLDAIVAEIEAREVTWLVENGLGIEGDGGPHYYAEVQGNHCSARADTAPLALCQALLSYLKEKP